MTVTEMKAPQPIDQEGSDLTARELLAPLFRRKRILVITFLSVFALVILYAFFSGPTYSAHMTILVDRERLDPPVSTEATTQLTTNSAPVQPEEVNSEIELLKSRDVLEKVAVANGMDKPSSGFSLGKLIHPHMTREDRIARAVRSLAKSLKTDVVTKTNVIEVSYTSSNPELSYGILKALGDFYAAKHVSVHRPPGSYEFFASEADRYRKALENAESKLHDFSRDTGIAAPDLQRSNLALQFANSVGLQHQAEASISADLARINSDQQQLKATSPRISTAQASGSPDRLLDALNQTLLAAQTKRTQLALKYDPAYPLIREADQEIVQAQEAIAQAKATRYVTETTDRDPTYELLRQDLARSQADLAAQRGTLAATKLSVQSIQREMVDLDQKALALSDLAREAKADENSYLLYLGKRDQEKTTDALDSTRIANVVIAVPPAIPVLPVLSWSTILIAALAAGFVLSIAAAYVAEYLDSSFHTPSQVKETLGIPIVITVAKKSA